MTDSNLFAFKQQQPTTKKTQNPKQNKTEPDSRSGTLKKESEQKKETENQHTEQKDKNGSGKLNNINETGNQQHDHKKENVSGKLNSITEIDNHQTKSDTEQEHGIRNQNTDTDPEAILNFERKTVEETHTRQTYLIRNDLLKRLNRAARRKRKGYKTRFVNLAIERLLDDLEK